MSDLRLVVLPAAQDYADRSEETLAKELESRIEGEVRFARHDRMLYATDASLYQVEPIGVAIPRTRNDLGSIVRFAHDNGLALLPRGGGTSLAGQCTNAALVVDASKYLREILEIDVKSRRATVEPGVVLDQLNHALLSYGLAFGPDVATSAYATIGGMIGNNSAGAHSVLYGRTVEHVEAIEAMLPDGTELRFDEGGAERDEHVRSLTEQVVAIAESVRAEVRARYPRLVRNSAGYLLDLLLDQIDASTPGTFDRVNLAKLLCASEGTLAMTVSAELALVDVPERKGLVVVAYDDVESALADVTTFLELNPAAIELLDDVVLSMARANAEASRYVAMMPRANTSDDDSGALLYVEFYADDDAALEGRFDALRKVSSSDAIRVFEQLDDMRMAWQLRKSGEPLLHGLPGARKPITFVEDTAVAPERLSDFVKRFKAIVERHGTWAAYYAHASVGCLHIRPLVDPHDPAERECMEAIASEVADLVHEFEGTISAEHGDGRVRSHLLERMYGAKILDAFRRIKRVFDPENRFNPGNIVDPAPMAEMLRYKPSVLPYDFPEVDTFYRYEDGFREAVEQCNGAGVCRKRFGGTMCPSYRGSLEERHATRGRGNALRLAISGQLAKTPGFPDWSDKETLETLDLCLACKACKAECPSNVDLARLKSEYLGHHNRSLKRLSLATLATGHIRQLNRIGSAMHRMSNRTMRVPLVERVMKRAMNVDARRSLPSFGESLFRWYRRRTLAVRNPDGPVVVYFPDCFTVYNEPGVGQAAIRTLERLGYRVLLPGIGCCGRSMISVGMMDEAIRTCSHTAAALADLVEERDPVAIVGGEPSCISAMTDDWPDLKLHVDEDRVREVADRAMTVDRFVETRWDHHPRQPEGHRIEKHVLLHGHCHEKALWGTNATSSMLARAVGAEAVRTLDTGCCGMAGSFGYPAKRYGLSMTIGSLSLFPSVEADVEALVAATGTSCRHQIRDGTGRSALHPIEILDRWMDQVTEATR